MTGHLPPAVVLGLSPTGLHAVRALGRAGVEVHGVAEGRQVGALSRYLASVIEEPDDERLASRLLALAEELAARGLPRAVLIPTSDRHIEFVCRHAHMLGEHFAFQRSYADGLAARIMAKDSFYALCEAHGVRYPAMLATPASELQAAVGRIRFPWLVKPAEIHLLKAAMRGTKGWIVRDEAHLRHIRPSMPQGAETLLAQEIVPGPESAITLCCAWFDEQGKPHQMFTARKLRQYPPGFGSASLVQSHAEPDSVAIFTRLLASIGYSGIAAGEFKRHPETGELEIIEINVRPSLWFSLSEDAGRPVVLAAYRHMAGLEPLPEAPQQEGLRWRYALKDMASALFYRVRRGFVLPPPDIGVCGPATRMVYPVMASDDAGPARGEAGLFLRKALGRLVGGRAKRGGR